MPAYFLKHHLIFKQQYAKTLLIFVHFALNLGKTFDSLSAKSALKPKSKTKYE